MLEVWLVSECLEVVESRPRGVHVCKSSGWSRMGANLAKGCYYSTWILMHLTICQRETKVPIHSYWIHRGVTSAHGQPKGESSNHVVPFSSFMNDNPNFNHPPYTFVRFHQYITNICVSPNHCTLLQPGCTSKVHWLTVQEVITIILELQGMRM